MLHIFVGQEGSLAMLRLHMKKLQNTIPAFPIPPDLVLPPWTKMVHPTCVPDPAGPGPPTVDEDGPPVDGARPPPDGAARPRPARSAPPRPEAAAALTTTGAADTGAPAARATASGEASNEDSTGEWAETARGRVGTEGSVGPGGSRRDESAGRSTFRIAFCSDRLRARLSVPNLGTAWSRSAWRKKIVVRTEDPPDSRSCWTGHCTSA